LLVILSIKKAHVDLRVQLAKHPHLAVLGRDQRLLHRRQLDVEVLFGKIEVGSEHLRHVGALPGDRERHGLVYPANAVVVEEARELLLRWMSELHACVSWACASDQARALLDGAAPFLRDGLGGGRRQGNGGIVLSSQEMNTPAGRMVAEQLLPHGVTDERVLRTMSEIPRDAFLPPGLRSHAYGDRALAIDCGQTISQPLVVALMTQALAPKPDDVALEVGAGCGYRAAVLSRLCRKVITLEREPALAEHASDTLARLGFTNVEVAAAAGSPRWPGAGPYDMILVACAADAVPPALFE